MHSHAQVPTALPMPELGLIRVYFAPRPRPNYSITSFVDVDIRNPLRVLYLHDRPIFEPGPPGSFDEHGVMPQCVIRRDNEVWLYYAGWSRRESIPYSNWIGLAISHDDGCTFSRAFSGPVLDRTRVEIYSGTGLFVVPQAADRFAGFYATGLGWQLRDGHLEEKYVIARAVSNDGVNWIRDGRALLPERHLDECTTRPSVARIAERWHMWFCHRGRADFRDGVNAYRIGYAQSADLLSWTRMDELAGIAPTTGDWDSSMIAYPYVVEAGGRHFMFYNGNGFGRTGFGVAQLERVG
ncbi:MAG: hypothetical protein JNM76_12305 [Betaproteobacteria bacterium]|nr:hypothetical protein [Betaproteobacteria bacterium]